MKSITNENTSNLRKKTITGIIWSAIQNWGRQIIASIIFFVLARLLGPESFGLVASAAVFLGFVEVFLDQGFSTAIIQRLEIEEQHLDTAFWINLLIGLILTTFSFFSAKFIATFFNQIELVNIIRCLSFVFILNSLSSVQEAILRRKLEFKPLAIKELAGVSIGGLVGLVMAFQGFGVWSLVCQQIVNSFVKVSTIWYFSDWRPGLKVSHQHFQDLFSFGINVVGIKLIDFFNRRTDDFLIGYFLGSVALGYYTVAYRLLLIILQLLSSVTNQVLFTSFAKLQLEQEKLRQVFYSVTQITSLISFPIFTGLFVLAHEFVSTFFGDKWLPSVPVMQILAFIGMHESIYFFYTTVVMAVGKPFQRLRVDLINVIINLIGFSIAVRWGILAVALSFVIRGYLLTPLALVLLKKLIKIEYKAFFSLFIPSVSACLIMSVGLFTLKGYLQTLAPLPYLLFIYTALGIAIYGFALSILAPKSFTNILNFKKLFN